MEDRKPMLSDELCDHLAWTAYNNSSDAGLAGMAVRYYYENLITTGKLRVVGTVKRLQVQETPHGFLDRCSGCSAVLSPMDAWCPRCGEKIEP